MQKRPPPEDIVVVHYGTPKSSQSAQKPEKTTRLPRLNMFKGLTRNLQRDLLNVSKTARNNDGTVAISEIYRRSGGLAKEASVSSIERRHSKRGKVAYAEPLTTQETLGLIGTTEAEMHRRHLRFRERGRQLLKEAMLIQETSMQERLMNEMEVSVEKLRLEEDQASNLADEGSLAQESSHFRYPSQSDALPAIMPKHRGKEHQQVDTQFSFGGLETF